MSLELLQSQTSYTSADSPTQTLDSGNLDFLNCLVQQIENGSCIDDLLSILRHLKPLRELKDLLLKSIERIRKTAILRRLYLNACPLDQIFSDSILCKIIPFLSHSNMYYKLRMVSKHFHAIMCGGIEDQHNCAQIYQQYTILIENLSCNAHNSLDFGTLRVRISHLKNQIRIDCSNSGNDIRNEPYSTEFCIFSISEMHAKCGFQWHLIPKWTFSIDSGNYSANNTNSLLLQLLQCASGNVQTFGICIKNMSNSDIKTISSPNMFAFSHLNNAFCMDLPNTHFVNLFGANLRKLMYLDCLTVDSGTESILKSLPLLLAVQIQFEEDESEILQKTTLKFPKSIEFIQILHFQFFSTDHVLDLSECDNMIALTFKHSTFSAWIMHSKQSLQIPISKHVRWPKQACIECLLLDEASNDFMGCWYRYFKSISNTEHSPKIRFLRYMSEPRITEDSMNDSDDCSSDNSNGNQLAFPNENHHKSSPKQPCVNSNSVIDAAPILLLNQSNKVNEINKNQNSNSHETHQNKNIKMAIDVSIDSSMLLSDINDTILDIRPSDNMDITPIVTPYVNNQSYPVTHVNKMQITRISTMDTDNLSCEETPKAKQFARFSPFQQLSPKYQFPLQHTKLLKIDEIAAVGGNDNAMKAMYTILSDEDNDALLWRLLLIDKYRKMNKSEECIDKQIGIYRSWFEQGIAKWIYHFGDVYSLSRNLSIPTVSAPDAKYERDSVSPINLEHYFETYYPMGT